MKSITCSISDLAAQVILIRAGIFPLETASGKYTASDAGNYIIQLAEKIKAERSVIAMQGRSKYEPERP